MDSEKIYSGWCNAYEHAWRGPGAVPHMHFNHSKRNPGHFEIVRLRDELPRPFHMGFGLGETNDTSGADAANIMLDIVSGDTIRNKADAMIGEIADICKPADMQVNDWHVCEIKKHEGEFLLTLYTEIIALNTSGTHEGNDILVGHGFGRNGMDKIRKLARLQDQRREIAEGPLKVDPILLGRLRQLSEPEFKKLADYLRKHPTVPPEEKGMAQQASWDRISLSRYHCMLPEGVETLIVKKGVVSGRVRLAPGTTWNGTTLIHANGAPSTMAASMKGRALVDVVDHPEVDRRLIVKSAKVDGRQALRITTKTLLEPLIP